MPDVSRPGGVVPGLTACSLCAGETLGAADPLAGGRLTRLRAIEASGAARLALSECLDERERGDVVVARPSARGRAASAEPVWFERLAGEELTGELATWLESGGPGVADVPGTLRSCLMPRSGETAG